MLYPQNGDRIVAIDSVTSPPYVYHTASGTQHAFGILTQRFQIALDDRRKCAQRQQIQYFRSPYTQGELTSQNLWSRYDRHFVGITRHNMWS